MTQLSRILFRADQAVLVGDWEEAQRLYQEARALDPDNTRAEMGLRNVQKLVDKADSLKARIAAADALLAQGNYKSAADEYIAIIDYAVAPPRILKFHPELERKRNRAKDLHFWQERTQKTLHEAKQLSDQENWEAASQLIEGLLQQLPQERVYEPMRDKLSGVRTKSLAQQDHQALINKAKDLLYAKDYEQGIALLENIPSDSSLYSQAQRWLAPARTYLASQKRDLAMVEAAIDEGRWTDALALLEQWRERYRDASLWKRLYLQAGLAYGHNRLDYGRQLDAERSFDQARIQFEHAQTIFEKVLDVYPAHLEAQALHSECVDLVAIAIQQAQAQQDWANGMREEAAQGLALAQQRLARAKSEGRDYPVIAAVVDTIAHTLQAEIERILEEKRRLHYARSLLDEHRLGEAYQFFMGTLDALLPEQQRQATEGLRQVEAQKQKFETLMAQGRTADAPIVAVDAYQDAYNLWPDGPDVSRLLENALIHACERAVNDGDLTEAVGYGNRALLLNPDNRAAKDYIAKAGVKPQVEAAFQRIQNDWDALKRKEKIESTALSPLLQDLEVVLRKVADWPDLRADLEALHKNLREARGSWQAYEQAYMRASQYRDNGAWSEALRALEKARAALSGDVPASVRGQLRAWREIVQVLEEARCEVNTALKQAQAAYDTAAKGKTLSAIADELSTARQFLEPARKRLENAMQQVTAAGGALPEDLAMAQQQIFDLDKLVTAVSEAITNLSIFDGLLKIQEIIRIRGSDSVLEAARVQLSSRARENISVVKQQAQSAIQAGDLIEAEKKLLQIRELDPEDAKIANLYTDIRQRRQLEARLRQIEREAEGKLASNSPMDAMRTFRQGLNVLLEPDVALPNTAREILSDLIALSDREDGLALGQQENWEKAQDLMIDLGHMRSANWTTERTVLLTDQWLRIARDYALRGVVASAAQLGDFLKAYRAASAYIKAHPTEPFAVEQLIERTEALVNQINTSAMKRLQRAKHALEDEDYETALHNLQDIEAYFYQPIEQEFPGLLDGYEDIQRVREEVKSLKEKSERLRTLYVQVKPQLEAARQAYFDSAWPKAIGFLDALPSLQEAPRLEAKVETLQHQIRDGWADSVRSRLHAIMNRIETGCQLATKVEQFDAYLEELEALPEQLNLYVLAEEDRERYTQLTGHVYELRQSLVEAQLWEQKVEEYFSQQRYVDALNVLDRALASTREASKRVRLEMRRDEIERLARAQQECENTLQQGIDLFDAEQYVEARQVFEKAQGLGVEVAMWLAAARAGLLLQNARRFWDKERDAESALLDLDELQRFVEDNTYAMTIADDALYLRRRIEATSKDNFEIRRAIAEAQRLFAEDQLTAAQDSVQAILERDPASQEALALQKRIREQDIVQDMLAQARDAQQEGRYNEGLQLVNTVLQMQPDNAEAHLLQRQIRAMINAGQAFLEVESLAKRRRFKDARNQLMELAREGVDPDKIRQVQQLVDKLEKEQWTRVIHPIQELYRDGEYAEAWNRCKQALGRTAAPELWDELQTLQGLIVNRWAEKRAQAARAQLQKTLEQETLRDLEVQLKPFLLLDPPPEGHWVQQFEDLLRETRTRRLRLRLSQARERYEDWLADDMRGTPQAALDIIKTVQEEAETLGTQVEFDVTLDAASLTAEIQEAMNQRDADVRRAERERWMDQALTLQAQLEDPDYIAEESPGRPELERVAEWAKQVFKISGYENDGQAREMANWAQHALTAFDRTQQALNEAQRLLRQRRFRDAEYELRGTGAVSPLLKVEHERQRELVGALRRAENHQNNEAWDLALQEYRQALALDPDLEPLLEKEMERCHQRLRERVSTKVLQALSLTPPDTATAHSMLAQAEEAGWITPQVRDEYAVLYDMLSTRLQQIEETLRNRDEYDEKYTQIQQGQLLYAQTWQFFSRADYEFHNLALDTFLLKPQGDGHPQMSYKEVYLRIIADRIVNGEDISAIANDVCEYYGDDLSHRVAIVISNQEPDVSGRFRRYEIRGKNGLAIIPLDRTFFDQAAKDCVENDCTVNDALASVIDQATGLENLYALSIPVSDDLSFFGRERILQDLIDTLNVGQMVYLLGLRKVGKTSIIQRLAKKLAPQRAITVIDIQDTAQDQGVWPLYPKIVATFAGEVQRLRPKATLPDLHLYPMPETFSSEVSIHFLDDLRALYKSLDWPNERGRLLLIIDEVDRLLPKEQVPGYPGFTTLFGQIRAANQQAHILDVLLVGVDPALNRMEQWEMKDNELYRALREVWVPPMLPDDVRRMIESLGDQMQAVQYTPEALDTLTIEGGGHPFITRQICSRAIDERLGQGLITVTKQEAHLAVEDFIAHDPYLSQLWSTRLNEMQYDTLRTLAEAESPLSRAHLLPATQRQEALASLSALEDYTLVRRREGAYEIGWDVFRKWIRFVELGMEA